MKISFAETGVRKQWTHVIFSWRLNVFCIVSSVNYTRCNMRSVLKLLPGAHDLDLNSTQDYTIWNFLCYQLCDRITTVKYTGVSPFHHVNVISWLVRKCSGERSPVFDPSINKILLNKSRKSEIKRI
jgi:hypothetical protein